MSPTPPSNSKIPCSIAIITSKADKLEPRLKALSEFAEIVICHGNAPEENLEIARRMGAVVVPQYDSDEPLLNSMTDKAAVRQVAMDASSMPWRFFMDRDDALSDETIAEIRSITTNPVPEHLVWRMPGRIFIEQPDGSFKEILHEAAYPSYQTRLVHKDVGARFRGLVHERLTFDTKRFSVGTMQSYYDFRWSKDRVAKYWKYLSGYAEKEVAVLEFTTFTHFLYWSVYRRVRTIVGYLYRIPRMYLRYGFTHSMPLKIELLIVRYHLAILWGSIVHYVCTRPLVLRAEHALSGKPVSFTRTYLGARRFEVYGRVLSIQAHDYLPAMRRNRWHTVTESSLQEEWQSAYFDTAMAFDLSDTVHLSRLKAALRPTGILIGSYQGAERELDNALHQAGFQHIHIWPTSTVHTEWVFKAVQ